MSERIGTVLVGLSLLALVGCSSKDATKCANGLATTRQALAAKDFSSAGQWREYAYKHCEDASQLTLLDKEIVDRQAAVAKEKADKAKIRSAAPAALGAVQGLGCSITHCAGSERQLRDL
ncbi:MAG: hypothetical protein QM784_25025 [Polyangiaceae bacterium]